MLAWISVALLALLLRSAAIALLTSATSASGVSGAGPGASGTASALLESDLSLDLSLDLPAATFLPLAFAVLPADLAVAAELLLERAVAVSVARVIASRLAQASAATSAAWRRFVKCFPQIPGELLRLSAHARAPLTRLILPAIWAEKRYRNGITRLVRWRSGARRGSDAPRFSRSGDGRAVAPAPEAVTLPTGAEMGIVPLEHRASDEINNSLTMSVEGIFDVGRSPPTSIGADHGNALRRLRVRCRGRQEQHWPPLDEASGRPGKWSFVDRQAPRPIARCGSRRRRRR